MGGRGGLLAGWGEAGLKAGAFLVEDGVGRALGRELAFVEDGHFGMGGEGVGGIVGDEDGEHFLVGEPGFEAVEEVVAGLGVESGEGFVEEEEAWLGGEGAGEGDALCFSAGEVARGARGERGSSDEVEHGGDAAVLLGKGQRGESIGDVGGDGEVREEGWMLGDKAGVAAAGGDVDIGGAVGEGASVEGDVAGVGGFEAGDEAEEGGLAGAGGAEDDGPGGGEAAGELEAEVASLG